MTHFSAGSKHYTPMMHEKNNETKEDIFANIPKHLLMQLRFDVAPEKDGSYSLGLGGKNCSVPTF